MKIKNKRVRRLADALGAAAQIDSFESFAMHMDHTGALTLKGCERVLECGDTSVSLLCGERTLRIEGSGLNLPVYSEAETVVTGEIASVGIRKRAAR